MGFPFLQSRRYSARIFISTYLEWHYFLSITSNNHSKEEFFKWLPTCLSPVRWASSTISAPNWLKAFTNSVKLETLSRRPRLMATLSLARRSCLTTTRSARRRTLVTEPRRHLAALTTDPRSARLSSIAHSHNFSIAEPATRSFFAFRTPFHLWFNRHEIIGNWIIIYASTLTSNLSEFLSTPKISFWINKRRWNRGWRSINKL